MAFLSAEATGGARASTLGRRVAAIRYAHKAAGIDPPTNSEAVKACMRGIRRSIGTAKVQKAPATADLLRANGGCPPGYPPRQTGPRFTRSGLCRRVSALRAVALSLADLVEVPDGLRVTILHSKTDQEGKGQEIAIPRGAKLRPVTAVRAWLDAAGITKGRSSSGSAKPIGCKQPR